MENYRRGCILEIPFQTLEDIDQLEKFSTEELKEELLVLQDAIGRERNEEKKMVLQNLSQVVSFEIENRETPPKENVEREADEMLLPEYRKDGYFNSDEFKKIEDEVDEYISNCTGVTPQNYDLLKQEVLKIKYNIDWLPYEKRFMPHVHVIVDRLF